MFHWICPECGREIPPAVKECPACDPSATIEMPVARASEPPPVAEVKPVEQKPLEAAPVAAPARVEPEPVLDPLLVLAETVRAAQAEALEPPPPQVPSVPETAGLPQLASAVGVAETPVESASSVEQVEETALVAVAAPVEPTTPAAETKSQPVALLAPPEKAPAQLQPIPAAPAPEQPAALGAAVEAVPEPPVALATPPQPPAQVRTAPLPETPAVEPDQAPPAMAGTGSEPASKPPAAAVPEPAAAEPPTVVATPAEPEPVPVAAKAEPAAEAPVAVAPPPDQRQPAPATTTPELPPSLAGVPIAVAPPAPIPEPVAQEQPVTAAASPAQQSAAPPPLPTEARIEPEPPPIATLPPQVVKQMAAPPKDPAVSDRPPSGSWLQLAPLQDFSSAASRITPVAPRAQILSPDSGPRMTLPGPALPPDLERLQEANPVTVIGEEARRVRRGMPGWLISLLLMIGIPIAGAALLFYFQPVTHSSADAKAAAVQEPADPAPAPASHALSQLIEVTGFRIVVDYNKKSEIHYLVVNHSAADLSDMTVYVTLRAAGAKQGQPPLCRFSFKAPGLGPYESKEMTSPIEKLARSISVPDWQDLRADVQVAP